MTILKRIVAAVDKYETRDGQEKKKYVTVGHVHEGKYGEYITLDPTVDLAGIRLSQRLAGIGKPEDTRITCNLYDNDRQQQGQSQQGQGTPQDSGDFSDDIPF